MSSLVLSTDEKNVNEIFYEIDRYWKYKNDFLGGIILYFKDLNNKHQLGLEDFEIEEFSTQISTKLLIDDLSQSNTLYVIAQFVCYVFFKGMKPFPTSIQYGLIMDNLNNIEEAYKYGDLKDNLRIVLNRENYFTSAEKDQFSKPQKKANKLLYVLGFGLILGLLGGIAQALYPGGGGFGSGALGGFAFGAVIGFFISAME